MTEFNDSELVVPTAYQPRFDEACQIDRDTTVNFIKHTHITDPVCDAIVEELEERGLGRKSARIFSHVLDSDSDHKEDAEHNVPPILREFIESVKVAPDWVAYHDLLPGYRMFHRNSQFLLASTLTASLIEGFSTNMSKVFFLTGRWRDQGVRRLNQNIRFTISLFLPGSMQSYGEGWQLALRTRLIHSKIRYLIDNSDEWDYEAWGAPIHATHLTIASIAFSLRTFQHAKKLGAVYTQEEEESYIQLWRYAGYLLGIPETVLFKNSSEANNFFNLAAILEPPPDWESIASANAVVHSTPMIFGITDRKARLEHVEFIYRLSRALLGDEVADELRYPKYSTRGLLLRARFQQGLVRLIQIFYPNYDPKSKFVEFLEILPILSVYDEGILYKMPDHLYSEETSNW